MPPTRWYPLPAVPRHRVAPIPATTEARAVPRLALHAAVHAAPCRGRSRPRAALYCFPGPGIVLATPTSQLRVSGHFPDWASGDQNMRGALGLHALWAGPAGGWWRAWSPARWGGLRVRPGHTTAVHRSGGSAGPGPDNGLGHRECLHLQVPPALSRGARLEG